MTIDFQPSHRSWHSGDNRCILMLGLQVGLLCPFCFLVASIVGRRTFRLIWPKGGYVEKCLPNMRMGALGGKTSA